MKTELEILKRRLQKIQDRIYEIESAQEKCSHDWNDIIPDTVEAPTKYATYIPSEKEYLYVPTGKYQVGDCYSRTCKNCNKKEYFLKNAYGKFEPLDVDDVFIEVDEPKNRK